jgi:hypothetical protein
MDITQDHAPITKKVMDIMTPPWSHEKKSTISSVDRVKKSNVITV